MFGVPLKLGIYAELADERMHLGVTIGNRLQKLVEMDASAGKGFSWTWMALIGVEYRGSMPGFLNEMRRCKCGQTCSENAHMKPGS